MKATEWVLGLSSCVTGNISRKTFEDYAANGVSAMEVSLPQDQYDSIDWKEAKKNFLETGVTPWSFHLPFYPFDRYNFASDDKALRENTVKAFDEFIKNASELGIRIAVLHASGETHDDTRHDEYVKIAGEHIADLCEKASHSGVTVAVETLPRTCIGHSSDDIASILSLDDRLRICFDTNHLLIERDADFVRRLGKKIVTLHVSDYDFRNERHWLPYEGKIDWVELVTALEDAGYAGPFMYEVGFKAPESITRRDLTYQDFVENYKACIHKEKAPVIGVPNEEACRNNSYYQIPLIN